MRSTRSSVHATHTLGGAPRSVHDAVSAVKHGTAAGGCGGALHKEYRLYIESKDRGITIACHTVRSFSAAAAYGRKFIPNMPQTASRRPLRRHGVPSWLLCTPSSVVVEREGPI